ncbi:hypothetical protein ACFQFC_29040 [Amorphoplanes digitatis]|uniref:Uncharacterized protein n=1 Tax=Actinoplanes digitatis TaxID=1868 RepID=A0A7W7MMP6_9ACTN|nr:hypothetical protein [Actinoplanes digitatis]MBB4760193.1 hypothetical protein [Actinoplanes digitatis]GID94795.1 hypothetical protein Adi01nite_42070 [Actinoplanes digitatis]
MPPSDGWYLVGPFIAVALVGFLAAVFWRMGLQWNQVGENPPRELCEGRETYEGLAIFGETEDYGLLCPAAATFDPGIAVEIRGLLAAAGIRSTSAARPDGRLMVLVFPEEVDEARRLVGGSPAL